MQEAEFGSFECMDDSDAAVASYAQAFLSGDTRSANLIESLKRRCEKTGNNFILMRVVFTLTHHQRVLFFENFLECKSCHLLSLQELVKSCAWAGFPEKSIIYAEKLARECKMNPELRCFVATQYARVGRFYEARELLEDACFDDESLTTERAIGLQFFEFLKIFDFQATIQMYNAACNLFRASTPNAIEQDIRDALMSGQSYLLLRMGDGEGAWILLGEDEERLYNFYYAANRKEFLQIWFEEEDIIFDEEFRDAVRLFNEAIGHANCLGGIYKEAIDTEFGLGSRRGIAWVVNVLRKVLNLAQERPLWAKQTRIAHLGVHYDLLLSGALSRLLTEQSRVGLISCHSNLPRALSEKYGIKEIEFYKVPGEQAHGAILGEDAVEGRHWPDRYRELCLILDQPRDRRGQLFLIAAGILGKVYAWKLKQAGAVVIDIGAVADLWMEKSTRIFPALPAEASLPLEHQLITLVDIGGLGGLQNVWRPHKDKIYPVIFEPNEAEAKVIETQLHSGGKVFTNALGDLAGSRTLNITKSLGCTSLLEPNSEFLKSYSIHSAFRVTQRMEVSCSRYEDLWRQGEAPLPDVLKIDTQGFEYQILSGFGDLLSGVLAVQLEAHLYPIYLGQKLLQDIVNLLAKYGLILRRMTPVDHFDGDLVEVDAWFTCNQNKCDKLSANQFAKLTFIESVWELPARRRSFGDGQFD